jgi:hypothetical protein
MQIRVLSENDVRSVLHPADAIDIQAQAFTTLAAVNSADGLGEKFFSRRIRKIGRIAQADQSQLAFLAGRLDRAVTTFLAERKEL